MTPRGGAESRVAAAGLAALAALTVGCESRAPERIPDLDAGSADAFVVSLPDALLLRFQTMSGTALEREGWEIEVLQMGAEVRVRGAVRTGGSSVPIFRAMDDAEYVEFWQWLSEFPLDRHRVEEDPGASQEGWRKTCKVDVVLGPEERLLAENRWTRPLLSPAWMQELEDRLHLMALEYANQALDEQVAEDLTPEEADPGVQRALEDLGDAEVTNLPGGSPGP